MAIRVDALNEMIDMENIVLARLTREQKETQQKEALKRAVESGEGSAFGGENGSGNGEAFEDGLRNGMERVRLKEEDSTREEVEIVPLMTNEMRNKQMLVAEMKKLKKGMERSVVWQRDEYWRVEKAMGKRGQGSGRKGSVDREVDGANGRHR